MLCNLEFSRSKRIHVITGEFYLLNELKKIVIVSLGHQTGYLFNLFGYKPSDFVTKPKGTKNVFSHSVRNYFDQN